jgi:hypothetical protein
MRLTQHKTNNALEAKYGIFMHRNMYEKLNGFAVVIYFGPNIYRIEF